MKKLDVEGSLHYTTIEVVVCCVAASSPTPRLRRLTPKRGQLSAQSQRTVHMLPILILIILPTEGRGLRGIRAGLSKSTAGTS